MLSVSVLCAPLLCCSNQAAAIKSNQLSVVWCASMQYVCSQTQGVWWYNAKPWPISCRPEHVAYCVVARCPNKPTYSVKIKIFMLTSSFHSSLPLAAFCTCTIALSPYYRLLPPQTTDTPLAELVPELVRLHNGPFTTLPAPPLVQSSSNQQLECAREHWWVAPLSRKNPISFLSRRFIDLI